MLTGNVVFCGDSITAGNHVSAGECYPELVAAALVGPTYHNIAVPSSSCDSANQGVTADALFDAGVDVNILFVMFGANDGLSKSAATFESDLASWVAARQSAGFTVVVLTMLPCGSYDSVAFRAAINANSREAYLHVVDLGDPASTMGAEAAKNNGTLYSDTVHPTAYGNTLLEPFVTAVLTGLLTPVSARFASVFAGVLR